jgi:hypothetical protein
MKSAIKDPRYCLMRVPPAITLILCTLAGGFTAATVARPHVVEHQINRESFALVDLYRSGYVATMGGSMAGLIGGLFLTSRQRKHLHQQQVVALLREQTGRADLSNEQRAAVAYVAEDIWESISK